MPKYLKVLCGVLGLGLGTYSALTLISVEREQEYLNGGGELDLLLAREYQSVESDLSSATTCHDMPSQGDRMNCAFTLMQTSHSIDGARAGLLNYIVLKRRQNAAIDSTECAGFVRAYHLRLHDTRQSLFTLASTQVERYSLLSNEFRLHHSDEGRVLLEKITQRYKDEDALDQSVCGSSPQITSR